jgi:deazaflavin-dependent oxidoreductase (nitroreductase family)
MMTEANPQQFLYLTTIGRRTGLPREIEIWFTEFEGAHYCIAEHSTANWLRNIQRNPAVTWRVGEQTFRGTARVVERDSDSYRWMMVQQRSRAKYGWGDGTVVELKPDPAK